MGFTLESLSLKIKFIIFLILFSLSQVSAQNLISNGGFESGITGWSNIAGGGGAATFGISTADKIEGTQAFQVSVSALGTNSWSIQTLGPSWTGTLYQTYSVSFWAKSSVPGAKINIIQQNLNYSVTTITLTSAWVQYQYDYIAFETNPQFKMQYLSVGNYLIDGISIVPTTVAPPTGNELKTLAARCNLNFGAAVSGGALQNDADYINTLKKEFGMVVAENEMKMGSLKPTETGPYNFAAADRLVNFAMASGIKVRGHTLVWHSQLPTWVETKTWTKATLLAYLKDYITTVVGRYKGKITEWDVANECIDDISGNPLRSSVWFNVIGEEVLDSAFKWTNQVDPNAKLFYNDYSAETMNSKSNAVYALVSRLKSRNAPIDGVGFQSHVGYTTAPTMTANWIVQADQNIKRLGALGLEVSITELDLGIPVPFTTTKYAQQATSYGNILRLALRNPSIVKTFTLWGFTDKYSWIPGFSNYQNGAALILYDDFTPKPAYTELVNILSANCPIPTNCTATISPSGPTTFCAGGKVDLNTNIAATYKWVRGSTQVGTTSSFTASISGLYKVEIMYANGCKATSTGINVTVNPLPVATVTASGATTFCQGNAVVLTANSSSSYTWKRSGTPVGSARTFTATTSGSYTVDILDANGCGDVSNPTVVTVNALPVATVTASGATTFCQGNAVVLTANLSSSYAWKRNGTPVGSARTFTATTSGSYTVDIVNANGCGDISNPTVVTVNALPVATVTASGATTFCQGNSVVLTANSSSSYAWKRNGTPVGSARTFTATTSGSYTVDILDANGCADSSPLTIVSVLGLNFPTVTITSAATTVCSGAGISFTATGVNVGTAPTYTWFRNNSSIGTGRIISLIPSNSDQITARVSAGGTLPACLNPTTDVSNVISLTVNSLPNVSITALGATTFNIGKFVTLTASPNFTFSWRNGTATIGSNSFLTASNSGAYFVAATNVNGCRNNSNVINVLAKPLVYTKTSLGDAATKIKMNFGTMVTKSQFTLNENGYRDTIVKQFNMLFPENELKFMRTEPVQNQFQLDYPDTVLAFARSNGKTSRGHCLVWHSVSQNPKWLTDRVWSTSPNRWTRDQLLKIMKNHIDSVVGHNKGKILEWDVVNEGINLADGHPNGLRKSFWQSIIGDDYIDSAFVYAHRADPSAYLYFNEFGAEYFSSFDQAKSDSVYSLMKRLVARGIPVHGVGFQAHASVYVGYGGLSNNIKRLGALGLRVSFTETDVSNTSNPAPLWATMVRACVDNANCTSFVSWGVDDLHSWYGKDCGCLIYDTLFQPKPTVYKAIWDELNKGRDSITTARNIFANTPAYTPTPKPLVSPLITYCQGAVSQPLTATGTKLRWYTTSIGGAALPSAPAPSTSVAGIVSYFVSQTLDWIEGDRAEIKVRINPSPVATITASGATVICQGNSVTLTANTSSTYSWTQNGTIAGTSKSLLVNTSGNYLVSITDANGCTDSSPVTVVSVLGINVPIVTITSSATTVCSGTGVTFTATGTNTGTSPTYAWFRNNTQIGTGATLTITPANGDQIMARLTAGGTLPACLSPTTDVSNVINLTVNPIQLPTVTISSSATTVCSGTGVTFTATGTNTGSSPTYAWFKNNAQIGTGTTLTITPANGDQITARLTAGGTLPACLAPTTDVSNVINLMVNPIQVPNVSIASSATTVCSGTGVTFTATGSNTGTAPTYAWFRNNTQVGTGKTLTFTPANGDQITARLTAGGTLPACLAPTTDVSNVINLTVNPIQTASVSIASSATTVCSGTGVTFTATGTNTGTAPTFAWFRNNTQIGTGAILTFTPTNGDQIMARLTTGGTLPACLAPTTATSNAVSMTVNPVLVLSVQITSSTTTLCSGTGVTFTATGTNIGSSPTYTWYRNNIQIGSGKTISVIPANADLIKAILTTSGTCISTNPATSNVVQLTVNPLVQASVSISASANPTCSNTGVTYTANAVNGGTNPSYVWTVNGTPQTANGQVFTYTPSHNDQIAARLMVGGVQNSCLTNSTATSNAITAQVTGTISTRLAIVATSTTICQGNTATFTTTASGTGSSPTYAWYVNGIIQNTSANTFSYTPTTGDRILATMAPGGNGTTCVLGGMATSNGVTLSVQPNQTGTVTIQSDQATVCAGGTVTLSATATNMGASPNYSWYVNGLIQSQGTSFSFIPSDSDRVTAIAQAGGTLPTCLSNSTATSNGVNLQVVAFQQVSVAITSSATQVCTGAGVTFTVTGLNGGSTPTYTWWVNNAAQSTGTTFTYTPSDGDVVQASIVIGGTFPRCLSNTSAISEGLTIAVDPCPKPQVSSITGPAFVATGTSNVTYSVPNVPGDNYQWTVPAGATITSGQGTNSITVDFGNSNSGPITLTQTNANGSTQVQLVVTVGTPPTFSTIVGPVTIVEGSTGIIYSVSSLAGTNYQWTVPTGAIITSGQGTSSITVDFGSSVSGSVFLSASNEFGTTTSSLPVQTSAVTNVEYHSDHIETLVYPNPFHSVAEVRVISPSSELISIELHDMNGTSLKSWTGLSSPVHVDLGDGLPSGVYTLTIKQKGLVKVDKLVKLN